MVKLPLPDNCKVPPKLLRQALTHSSYAREHKHAADNERLEFLGDAVVELAFSEYLYRSYPRMSEGELTLARANAVSMVALAKRARELNLGSYIRLSQGERKTGGQERDSILADAFEALVGAIYLGCGWEAARDFVIQRLTQHPEKSGKDSKSLLQEMVQAVSQEAPYYEVVEAVGPDHARVFTVRVSHQGKVLGKGKGSSKKEAEQAAAQQAITHLTAKEGE
jgi:ribonuclease-3